MPRLGCSDSFLENLGFSKTKNLKSGNFRFLIFQVKIFTFFKSKSVNLFEFNGVVITSYVHVPHSSVRDNLRALLGSRP